MQGVHQRYRPLTDGGGKGSGRKKMELMPSTLTIDVEETSEGKIQRLISENPVIIFSRSSCCMCHVMKRLLSTLGVYPTVIELEEGEMSALPAQDSSREGGGTKKSDNGNGGGGGGGNNNNSPAVFIGGVWIGGLESLMGLHLGGNLVPKLREVGAL